MPSPSATPTPITPPRVPLIDERTGLIDRAWYMFFLSLFRAAENAEDPALGSNAESLIASYDEALRTLAQTTETTPVAPQLEQQLDGLRQELQVLPQPQLGTFAALQQANLPWTTFDATAEAVPTDIGTVAWDGGTTLGIQMTANVLQRVGESEYVYAKASATITKGQLCYHTGAVGSSGTITAAPTPLALADPNQIVGVAAESIALNDFGLIQVSGVLRGFDTTGSSVGEVWADGDPLYYNPAFIGSMTKTEPSAPNQKSYIGEVINAGSGGSGSMHIRIVPGTVLGGTDSNVQFSALANNDLIQYDSGLGYWKNVPASTLPVGTATNIAGGAAGSVPYQTAPSTTTFLPIGTALQVLKVNAGATAPQWVSGAALTKTDDTNVTLTLGGTPATSLLAATSLTLGWTGTLSPSRGGTGLSALGSGVATWLGTPSSANLAAAVTDETGSGALVFGTAPTISDLTVTGTSGNVYSSTWTPTVTAVTNAAATTASVAQFTRVGDVVTFSGQMTIDPTATGNTAIRMSLPVASNFSSSRQAAGTFAPAAFADENVGAILADITNDELLFRYVAKTTANTTFSYAGSYLVV